MADKVKQHEARERFRAKMKAEGRKRVELWIKAEEVEAFQEAARTGHGLRRLWEEALAIVLVDARRNAEARMTAQIERWMRVQLRTEAGTWPEGSNELPPRVRFLSRPPPEIRRLARKAGWRWEKVSGTWWLPAEPESWPASERVLDAAAGAGVGVDRLDWQARPEFEPATALRTALASSSWVRGRARGHKQDERGR